MQFESPASLQERWCEIFREIGEPQALLACTYTFNADFFSELLDHFAQAACEGGAGKDQSFAHVPVNVVCDSSQYRRHPVRSFNVTLWPESRRLFHPKLFIILFNDEVVWSDGSLNLTRQGWHHNREIAMLHRPGWKGLPGELRELLKSLDSVAAARIILESTSNVSFSDSSDEYLTSLHVPIGKRFLASVQATPHEVHLVAPFFENDEDAEEGLDEYWFRLLTKECRFAQFHIYLPMIEDDPLTVQGSKELFVEAERHLVNRIILHPVERSPGPLHAKIACLVHIPGRIKRAHMLVGSPNMTRSALMAPVKKGNIESAWILDVRWEDVKRLFRGLGVQSISINEAKFVPPVIRRKNIWAPLKQAVYDPMRHELRIKWKDFADSRKTIILYAGKTLSIKGDICLNFKLENDTGWLVTRKRSGGTSDGFFPIEIPVESLPFCQSNVLERTPDDWLKMLGSVTFAGAEVNRDISGKSKNGEAAVNIAFKWSERVRDLSSRMRYFAEGYSDTALNISVQKSLLKLFNQIFNSHDPCSAENSDEQVWRAWVRLELWQTAVSLAAHSATRKDCADWRNRARILHRRLGVSRLEPVIRSQIKGAVNALKGAV